MFYNVFVMFNNIFFAFSYLTIIKYFTNFIFIFYYMYDVCVVYI